MPTGKSTITETLVLTHVEKSSPMPANASFSQFKTPGSTGVSTGRRIYGSLSQKFKSMTTSDAALEAADKAALAGGTTSAACTIACAAGATGAFAVAASGPIAAGALGAIGLVLAAKSTYSKRDDDHNALQPYVWSYIDNTIPKQMTDANRQDVGAAAMSLICDGQSQQKLSDIKFRNAESAFNAFWKEYQVKSRALNALSTKNKEQMKRMDAVLIAAYNNEKSRLKILSSAFSPNGAAYEFMRRLVHCGNYLQAPTVVGMVMQKDRSRLQDLKNKVPKVNEVRDALATISDRLQRDETTYLKVQEIITG